MKTNFWKSVCVVCALSVSAASAQETNEVEQLKKELRDMHEQMLRMEQKLESLEQKKPETAVAPPKPAEPPPATPTAEQVQQLNEKVDSVVAAQTKILPSEFNPSIGFVGETIFSYRSQPTPDGVQPGGWDVFQRTMELNVAASVDPFAKGYAVINAEADAATGEASVGVEEAAIETTSLPWNLELKAGRFFGEYGRLSYIHDHELPFVNRPLVLDEYIGGESQTDGLQVNWLPPIEHYVSVTAGVGDKFGDDPNNPGNYRAFNQLDFWGRVGTYLDLSPNWQLEGGFSGLWGPKTGSGTAAETQPDGSTVTLQERVVLDLDLKLSYVPLRNNQFQSLVWGTEVLYCDNSYLLNPDGIPGNPAASSSTIDSLGLYSYVTYKWSRQWSAGFMFDWVQNPQDNAQNTYSYSPYLTFALSHWNQLRLQYTHTDYAGTSLPSDDAVYLQWAWIIGAHSHGWQAR